jgi:predicted permease
LILAYERFRNDLTVALRSLRRSPTFAFTTILILGLGIGMSTAMFSIYKTMLIDRLPVADQDRLVVMHPLDRTGAHLDVPYYYLDAIRRDSSIFRAVAGLYHLGAIPAPYGSGAESMNLVTGLVSPNFFTVLGTRPFLGRLIRDEDGQPGAERVIVISYAAWKKRFGGDRNVIGRTMIEPATQTPGRVIGVAPPGFAYPVGADAWISVPPGFTAQVDVVARLHAGITAEVARAELVALMKRFNPFTNDPNAKALARDVPIAGAEVRTYADTVVGDGRATIVALTLAVALLLLIACANVGSLVLVRLTGRQREIAVRRAIGASFGDILHLFVIENALLGIAGALAGLFVAVGLLRSLAIVAPFSLSRLDAVQQAGASLAATTAVSIAAMLLFGLAPSAVSARVPAYVVLRSDSRTGAGKGKRRARSILVAAQLALAVVLLAGATLLTRTLARLQTMNLGYQPEHLSILSFTAPASVFDEAHVIDVAKGLLARIAAEPGVVAATPIESMPFKGQSFFLMKLARADAPAADAESRPFTPFEYVGPDYFRTFDIPILRGRGLAETDTRSAAKVVVVNETLAAQLWPKGDPIGKQLRNVFAGTVWTVVGVAANTHFRELRNVGPVAYFNWDQAQPFWNGYFAVRTSRPLAALLPAFRRATTEYDARISIWDSATMHDLLAEPLAQPRLGALLLAAFSFVALLVSIVGLYGLMSSAVRQQTRDIGVRIALGATASGVRRLVLDQALRILGVGAAAGLVVALGATRLLSSQLFGVTATDARSLIASCVILVVAGATAAYLPARRAARIDPIDALRSE